MNVYTLITKDGRTLEGEIHGSGGVCRDDKRLRRVIRERLREEETGESTGHWTAPKHLGNVTIWTDPDNTDCSKRGTTMKADAIAEIRKGDVVVYKSLDMNEG